MINHLRIIKLSDDFFKFKSFIDENFVFFSEKRSKKIDKNLRKKAIYQNKKDIEKCPFCNIETDLSPIKAIFNIDGSFMFYPSKKEQYFLYNKASVLVVNNLYEIIPMEYWKSKYKIFFNINEKIKKWYNFVIKEKIFFFKNYSPKDNEYLFFGQHNLNIFNKHIDKDGKLYSKYLMSHNEIFIYYKAGIETMKQMLRDNFYIKHITWFENFLENAGASIKHLHRQLIALDEIPDSIKKLNKLGYNGIQDIVLTPAEKSDLIIKNFGNIKILSGIGYSYPTIEIIIERKGDFFDVIDENFDDLIDALFFVYKKIGQAVSYNENFYYSFDNSFYPFFLISLRDNKMAGFEMSQFPNGYSQISPLYLKKIMV